MWSMKRGACFLGVSLALSAHCAAQSAPAARLLRVIPDPGAHSVWLLQLDPLHPAGPGRLTEVRAPGMSSDLQGSGVGNPALPNPALSLVRTGDHILIEQHTPQVDSWLSGVALEPAGLNTTFRLRLAGGQVLRAVAIHAGKARLAPQSSTMERRSEWP